MNFMTMSVPPDFRQCDEVKVRVSEIYDDAFNIERNREMMKQESNGTNKIDAKTRRAKAMKKMNAAVNQNDRVVINIINRESIQYVLVEAKTDKETLLGKPIEFSLSVKKYFGVKGRMLKELYDFKSWHNPKLQIEMKRIWRALDEVHREKEDKAKVHPIETVGIVDDERAA